MAAGESSPLREALSISTESSQGVGNLWCLEAVDPHKDASSVSIVDSLSVKFQLLQQPSAKAPWPGWITTGRRLVAFDEQTSCPLEAKEQTQGGLFRSYTPSWRGRL